MLVTILIFFALIAVLILVHEAGHFFAARIAGVKVEEFGFGFPPRLAGAQSRVEYEGIKPVRKWRAFFGNRTPPNPERTVYSLNWIPFGGFVKIYGEEGDGRGDSQSFSSRSARTRALILAAGVGMNIVLAMALFSGGRMAGLPTVIEEGMNETKFSGVKIQVIEVAKNSPVAEAGLAVGDTIRRMDGRDFKTIDEVRAYVDARRGETVLLEVLHDTIPKTLSVTPRRDPPAGQGPMGFAMVKTGIEKLPWYRAIPQGVKDTLVLMWLLLKALAGLFVDLFARGEVPADVAGPVGIAVLTGRVAKLGLAHLLQFAGVISANLALINIFPIPALDGGRLLFVLLEKIRRRPVPRAAEQRLHQVGFALLLTLMLLITVRDVLRLL